MHILITYDLPDAVLALFTDGGITFDIHVTDRCQLALARTYDGIFLGPETILEDGEDGDYGQLKVIAKSSRDNNILDLDKATRAGVLVLHPSRGLSASIADYAIWLMLALTPRGEKPANELKGKTLGILGLGNVGAALAKRAKGFDMHVICYDPTISRARSLVYGVESVDLVDLMVTSDYVSIHLPMTPATKHLLGKDALHLLKEDAKLIHLSDPEIFVWEDLLRAIDWGYLHHLAIDLPGGKGHLAQDLAPYPQVLTSIGQAGNTIEARDNIDKEMAAEIIRALANGESPNAINVPLVRPSMRRAYRPYLKLMRILGQFLAQYVPGRPKSIAINVGGSGRALERGPLVQTFLTSFATAAGTGQVNYVNADHWAQDAGIKVNYTGAEGNQVTITTRSKGRPYTISASVGDDGHVVITHLDEYSFIAHPTRHLLLVPHINRPGMVGRVGSMLGENNINISGMVLGQKEREKDTALMWITVDDRINLTILNHLKRGRDLFEVKYIELDPEQDEPGDDGGLDA